MSKRKMTKKEILIVLIIFSIFILLLWFSLAFGGGRIIIRHFDNDYNITGYSKFDGKREDHFDRDSNRTGHSIYEGGKRHHFDHDFNRDGYSETKDGDEPMEGDDL